jgi:predicted 3-demethylubiquinone-9 3-methyltransferase (glyoxalase superfamily)
MATFVLNGTEYMAMDSALPHPFNFTPSVSFFVTAENEAEFDALFTKLPDGGQTLMPPNNYGFSQKFAWLNDRYGVSWQLNVE